MKNRTIVFVTVGMIILVGLVYGVFLVGYNAGQEVASAPTPECQPIDSPWCQNLIPGCRPITAKRCQQLTISVVEPVWPFNQKPVSQPDPLEVKRTGLGFYTLWLICILLFAVWWISRRRPD